MFIKPNILNKSFNVRNKLLNSSVAHNTSIILKADTGASKHYLRPNDAQLLTNINTVASPITVHLPNNNTITSTTRGQLPFKALTDSAKQAYILPSLTNSSLLSIGQLCNENCTAIFTKRLMLILHKGKIILTGNRNYSDGLWDILCHNAGTPGYKKSTVQSNNINILTARDKRSHELANFLHACAGSPSIRTFQDAINNNFLATWPGIDKLNMKYLITDHTNIALGHLDQERKNVQSTKVTSDTSHTHNILTKLIPFSA